MTQFCVIVLLSTAIGVSIKIDIVSQNGLNYIQTGGSISLNCSFSLPEASTSAWFKQTPGEKPLLVASAHHSTQAEFHNGFINQGRFIALREKSSFILTISDAEPSDSATYFCSVTHLAETALADSTVLVLKGGPSNIFTVYQNILDPVQLGYNTTLQCSVLTDNSAGDHSVYWFRQGSGESQSGIIYTHRNRSDQCKKSSGTGSPTQSCVYKLPKKNLSLSDAGTYYCAVAACGEILFGKGSKLEFVGNNILMTVVIVLAASNMISVVMVLFLCRKIHTFHHKGAGEGQILQINQVSCDEDLNYAALSFSNKPASQGNRRQQRLKDTEVYSQVKFPQ